MNTKKLICLKKILQNKLKIIVGASSGLKNKKNNNRNNKIKLTKPIVAFTNSVPEKALLVNSIFLKKSIKNKLKHKANFSGKILVKHRQHVKHKPINHNPIKHKK